MIKLLLGLFTIPTTDRLRPDVSYIITYHFTCQWQKSQRFTSNTEVYALLINKRKYRFPHVA